MEDVLEVYHRPYDECKPMICLDEASKQLVAETRKAISLEPGQPKRVDAEYRRCGTASVFMLNAPLEGRRHVRVREQRTRDDFAEVIRELCDELYPAAERIVLVMDQLNTHGTASLYQAFVPHEARRLAEKLEIHHTPKHGSWLNMAEIEIGVLSRQCLGQYLDAIENMVSEVAAWETDRNAAKTKVDWQFTTDDARRKLKNLYPQSQTQRRTASIQQLPHDSDHAYHTGGLRAR